METPEKALRQTIAAGIALSVCGSLAFALWPGSDGRTAVALNGANLALLGWHLLRFKDPALLRLLLFGAVFGLVELVADALCVRMTKTLDYSVARSAMLIESPWWMPLAWAIVAIQLGCVGAWLIHRFGGLRGILLCALAGTVQIPFYEEMAYHARWWRYINCRTVFHTPLYIILAESLIAAALAPLVASVMGEPSKAKAALAGALGGLATIVGGMIGYGVCEFIPNGFRLP